MGMLWRQTWVADPKARELADRHYSRGTVGAAQFAPPGYKVVLVLPGYKGLWVSQTVTPGMPRADGGEYWYCSLFRNESSRLASVLIRQAIEATLWVWRHHRLPADGFRTFIKESAIQAPPTGKAHGWTFEQVGFQPTGYTKWNHLLRLELPLAHLLTFTPRPVPQLGGGTQASLFEEYSA